MRHYQIRSEEQHRPELVRVILTGELDLAAQEELARTLRTVAAEPSPRRIEIDICSVRLLGCGAIGTIIAARREADARGTDLYLTGARGTAARTLQATGLWVSLTGAVPAATG